MPVELKVRTGFPVCAVDRSLHSPAPDAPDRGGSEGCPVTDYNSGGQTPAVMPLSPTPIPGHGSPTQTLPCPAYHGAVPTSSTHRQHRNLSRPSVSPLKTNKYPPTMLPRCFASLEPASLENPCVPRVRESRESTSPPRESRVLSQDDTVGTN